MRRDEVISVRDECDTFFNDCNDVLQESQRASSQAPWLPACTSVPLLARTSGHGMTRPRPHPHSMLQGQPAGAALVDTLNGFIDDKKQVLGDMADARTLSVDGNRSQ